MDRLEAMTVFVAVADLHGFAPAARRLKLSPSVVTRQIAALEERLGTRLLQRTTRSVTLTDAGARYLERARRIVADVLEAEGALEAERAGPSGRLVVTASNVFGRMYVAPVLGDLLAKHDGVVGELTLTDRKTRLVEEGIDAAVRIGVLEDSALIARHVGETRRVLVASPEYLGRRPALRTPEDLKLHDTIQYTRLASSSEWRFRGAARATIKPRLVTNKADTAMDYALAGRGITMLMGHQVMAAVRARKLVVLLREFEPAPLPIHVVYPTTRQLSPSVRAFLDDVGDSCDWRFVDF